MNHPEVVRVRSRLNECKGHWAAIEKASGVSYSWLSKFARGEMDNPTVNTLQSVSDACEVVCPQRQPA